MPTNIIRKLLGLSEAKSSAVVREELAAKSPEDPLQIYVRYVRSANRYLSLKGLLHGHVPKIALQDVYIALKVVAGDGSEEEGQRKENVNDADEQSISSVRTRLLDTSFYRRQLGSSARSDVDHVLASQQRLVILGEPGSGKSTFIKYIASRIVEEPNKYRGLFQTASAPVPLIVTLRAVDPSRLPDRRGFSEMCIPEVLRRDIPGTLIADLLNQGSCLVVFDGLDEIADVKSRRRVAAWIESFADSVNPRNRFIVASRIVGYREAALASGFTRFTLCEFDDEDVRSFVKRWYEAVLEDESDAVLKVREVTRRCNKLIEVLKAQPGINQLARNPLLLTIVLLVYSNRLRLPEERSELYQQCVDVLLEHLQQAKYDDALSSDPRSSEHLRLDQRRDLLKRVARWLHENGRIDAPEQDIVEYALSGALPGMGFSENVAVPFLRQIEDRSGLLVDRGQRMGFSHLAFQEFLTALSLADADDKEQVVEFLSDSRFRSWWREVICLYAAIVPDSSGLLSRLLEGEDTPFGHGVLLTGACLADARAVRDVSLRSKIVQRLAQYYMNPKSPFFRLMARDVLVRIGGKEVTSLFVGFISQSPAELLSVLDAVDVLSRIGGKDMSQALLGLALKSDVPEKIRLAALRGLRVAGMSNPELEDDLFSLSRSEASSFVRQEAIATLGVQRVSDDHLDGISRYLEDIVSTGVVDDVYVATLKAFVGRMPLEAAFRLIRFCLGVDGVAEYKVEVCRALLNVNCDESVRIDFLLDQLAKGVDWGARGGAALVLGMSSMRREEIAHRLVRRLIEDRTLGVALRVAEALAHLAWTDSVVLGALRKAIEAEQHTPTRWRLIESYSTLARDGEFLSDEVVPVLMNQRIGVDDRLQALAILDRVHYQEATLTQDLLATLMDGPPKLVTKTLEYLTKTCRLSPDQVRTFVDKLKGVAEDSDADAVLRDRALETLYRLHGMADLDDPLFGAIQ